MTELLRKLVKWINSIGEPKTVNHLNLTETISAIKVKQKQPEVKHNSSWVTQEPTNPKQYTHHTGSTSNVGYNGTSSINGNASTSAYRNNNIKVGGKYFDANTFQEIFPEDLRDLLSDGDNIAPTDMWQMDMKKKSTPQMRSVLNKSSKK